MRFPGRVIHEAYRSPTGWTGKGLWAVVLALMCAGSSLMRTESG